jgi:nitroimidazol reductase NimA-like FMN-containing flavoprotein (pyridoxamine 5'-phosphate oxidase superfamily)
MLDEMQALAKQRNICVMATVIGQKPYCSLMAYVMDDPGREIYMVTHRRSRKYQNLMENPCVSLLIDTRERLPRDQAQSLTVEGVFEPLPAGRKQDGVRAQLLSEHPQLKEFMRDPAAEIFCIRIQSFLLLKGISEAHYAEMEPKDSD